MCYAAPGPRCSGHTKAALVKSVQRLYDAHEAIETTFDGVRAGTATDADYRQAHRAAQAAMDKRVAAEKRFDASPDGIAQLEERVARNAPREGIDTIVGTTASRRLEEAKRTRGDQVAAYQALHSTPPSGSDDGPDQVENPIPQVAEADAEHFAALTRQEHARLERFDAFDQRAEADAARSQVHPQSEAGMTAQSEYEQAEAHSLAADLHYAETREQTRVAWESTMTTRQDAIVRGELAPDGKTAMAAASARAALW